MYLNAVAGASSEGSDFLVLNNIAEYASEDMKIATMAKVDPQRTDY